MRRLKRLAPLVLLSACAVMGEPPGGRPDRSPPRLVATVPESLVSLEAFDDWVEFRFDEVVSEGSQPNFGRGTGDLEKAILLSPSADSAVPRIRWERDRILVRPRGRWRPNTVYRIELAQGIMDLRRNRSATPAVLTFVTGGPLPRYTLTGRVIDWAARRGVPLALVEATRTSDTLTWRTLADSAGRFSLGPLPDGTYLVRGTTVTRGQARRATDPWDTVRVADGRGAAGEIWVFARDSAPPTVRGNAELVDSFTIGLTFSQPVDPTLRVPAESIRVLRLPDSVSVGPVIALPQHAHDSAWVNRPGQVPAAGDTTVRRPPATTPPVRAADSLEQRRPPLGTRLLVRVRDRLLPGTAYFVEVRGVRAAGGAVAPVITRRLETPKPAPPDTTRRPRPDSTGTPPRSGGPRR